MRRSVSIPLATGVFAAGLLAANTVSAAPQDCLPVVGCVTTSTPSLPQPPVTVPPLPTLPTTASTGSGPGGTTPPTTTPGEESRKPQAALSAKASVRVRGHGAGRIVEIRISLSKPARVSALLTRSSRTLARRQFAAPAGSSVLVLRVVRTTKPGAARLALTYNTNSGETARAGYRLRLPR